MLLLISWLKHFCISLTVKSDYLPSKNKYFFLFQSLSVCLKRKYHLSTFEIFLICQLVRAEEKKCTTQWTSLKSWGNYNRMTHTQKKSGMRDYILGVELPEASNTEI